MISAAGRKRWLTLLGILALVAFIALPLYRVYARYRDWHYTKAAPLFSDIDPPDGATVFASDAFVRWSSPVEAKGRVLWRKAGGYRVHSSDAGNGEDLLAHLDSLSAGAKYEYVVEESDGVQTLRSPVRTVNVQAGLAFDPVVEQTVDRDYDQTVKLTLRNRGTQPVKVAAKALKQFEDLPSDITGYGSVEVPGEVLPNGTLDLRLAVTAADATKDSYEVPVEAAGAYVSARFHVRIPKLNLAFKVVGEDPKTLSKTVEVVNNGDLLSDLSVRIVEQNETDLGLEPAVNHMRLRAHDATWIVATPVLYLEFESLNAQIEAKAAGQSAKFPLEFKAPPGMHLIAFRSASIGTGTGVGMYCSNNPNTCSIVPGPPGNGAQTGAAEDPPSPEPGGCPPKCNIDDACKTVEALLKLIGSDVDEISVNEPNFSSFAAELNSLVRRLDVDLACRLSQGADPGIEKILENIHRDANFKSLASTGWDSPPNGGDCAYQTAGMDLTPNAQEVSRCGDYHAIEDMENQLKQLAGLLGCHGKGTGFPELRCPNLKKLEDLKTGAENSAKVGKGLSQLLENKDKETAEALESLSEGLEKLSGFLEKLISLNESCEKIEKILEEIEALRRAIDEINNAGCNSQQLAKGFDDLAAAAATLAQNLPIPDEELSMIVGTLAENKSFFQNMGCQLNPECRWNREFQNVQDYIPNCSTQK
jgi:hypothetical protein